MGKHAIIVIKNEKNEYLQYYDEKWNSYLFLNCKIENEQDINLIKEKLVNDLNIEIQKIECEYVGKKQHKKFSESEKREKEYEHYFYKINIMDISNDINKKYFEINNIKLKWFSYNELKCDERVQKVNSDIVNFVKEFQI